MDTNTPPRRKPTKPPVLWGVSKTFWGVSGEDNIFFA